MEMKAHKLSSSSKQTIVLSFLFAFIVVHSSSDPPPFSCYSSNPVTTSFPFCNATLPIKRRVEDLISRLTLDEKISQLVNSAPAVPRLNLSAYQWWSEALHGVSRHGKGFSFNGSIRSATMFPQVIHSAAAFDSRLWYRIAQAIGIEARAMFNAGQAKGMTFWAPNINIFRDPRWGRGQETPGEDPLVTGAYSVSYVRGLQGDSYEGGKLKYGHLAASACCKHFTAYDLDNWNGVDRYIFDARVTKQDLADTYQPPFMSCVQQGQASGIMCAYDRVNGIPNCADHNLLTETARGQWGFQGYIVSDCDAVAIIHDNQRYVKLPEDAVADVLKAGMDVNCGSYLMKYSTPAIQRKKVQESEIDRALSNLFTIRMRLGLFNGDQREKEYGIVGRNQVCSRGHQDLALEAARNGIVLLKNSANLLPLEKVKTTSLAVIGPNANTSEAVLGNYEGFPCKNATVLQALQNYVDSTIYHQGCNAVSCTEAATAEAVNIAKAAGYVVLVMGLDQTQEREKHDRTDLALPGNQENLISSVAEVAKSPVVLVVLSGGPVDITFANNNPKIGSILWAGYPGEAGGIALAETIFGDHNPGGKLPVTWYPKDFIEVPMTDMRMRPEPSSGYPGRTYRFYEGKRVFEFGYGLSYSNYSYEFLSVSQSMLLLNQSSLITAVQSSGPVRYVSVSDLTTNFCNAIKFYAYLRVQNHGKMHGQHPVLLFLRQDKVRKGDPRKQLIGFVSVRLKAGENMKIKFAINPCEHLSNANEDGLMVIKEGTYHLVVEDREHPISIML